eukprot:1017916-Prorocentrum_minimum.AAC.1
MALKLVLGLGLGLGVTRLPRGVASASAVRFTPERSRMPPPWDPPLLGSGEGSPGEALDRLGSGFGGPEAEAEDESSEDRVRREAAPESE